MTGTAAGFRTSSAPGSVASHGFTLIEVLLGLALLALVVSLVQGVYSGVLRSRDVIEERTERSHAAALLFNRMADELASAVAPSEGTEGSAQGIALDEDAEGDSRFEFTAQLPEQLQTEGGEEGGGLARVTYQVEKAEDGARNLIRIDSRSTGTGPSGSGTADEGEVLLPGISAFRARLIGEGDNWEDSLTTDAPSPSGTTARALMVELRWKEGKSGEGEERVIRTVMPIYAAPETP